MTERVLVTALFFLHAAQDRDALDAKAGFGATCSAGEPAQTLPRLASQGPGLALCGVAPQALQPGQPEARSLRPGPPSARRPAAASGGPGLVGLEVLAQG